MKLLFENWREYLKESKNEIFFIRDTQSPKEDAERNFSCYAGAWVDLEQEALSRQNERPGQFLQKPKQDPETRKWCYDPELGLSGYAVKDEKEFNEAYAILGEYGAVKVALFISGDYDLGAGADGEDIFRDAKFIKYISSWEGI